MILNPSTVTLLDVILMTESYSTAESEIRFTGVSKMILLSLKSPWNIKFV